MFVILSIIPVAAKSFVRIKNGKREGTKILAQTKMPFNATALYFAGFIAIKTIIISKQNPRKIEALFNFFLL